MSDASNGWIVAGASTIIATLATAVATLFKINENKSISAVKALEQRVNFLDVANAECIKDRQELNATVVSLSVAVARLEGKLSHFISDVKEAGDDDDGIA